MSCQYEYNSPGPGYIDIRLKTVSNDIPIAPVNNFFLKVNSVEAIRSDRVKVPIYQDLKAFARTANIINTLDTLSRDSIKILGAGYAPPADYMGINLLLEPYGDVILDGSRSISICKDEACGSPFIFSTLSQFHKGYQVKEGAVTHIVLTINLDSMLVRGAEKFYFRSELGVTHYISSITIN